MGVRWAAAAFLTFAAAPQYAAAAPCAGDTAHRDAFWSACLTVGRVERFDGWGYRGLTGDGDLSATDIVAPTGARFRIGGLYVHPVVFWPQMQRSLPTLVLTFYPDFLRPDHAVARHWMLRVGGADYELDGAAAEDGHRFRWPVGPGWMDGSIGDRVTVSLRKSTVRKRTGTADRAMVPLLDGIPPV